MRVVSAIVVALCSVWLFCQPAFAERRIALVIGNSAYERVPQLTNPPTTPPQWRRCSRRRASTRCSSSSISRRARCAGALRDFADKSRSADVAIIYFAGHGIEIEGTNYLIPVDAVLERDIDAVDEAIPLDRLLTVIEPARQPRLVILDACRDNPFAKSMKHAIASRRSSADWPRSSLRAPTRWSPMRRRPVRPPPTGRRRTARSRQRSSNICRRRASICARPSASSATTS